MRYFLCKSQLSSRGNKTNVGADPCVCPLLKIGRTRLPARQARGFAPTLIIVILTGIFFSGCIRLWGGAGYVKETPRERTERVVGFDTAKAFEQKQTQGSVTT